MRAVLPLCWVCVLQESAHCAGVCSAVGAHGWNISRWFGFFSSVAASTAPGSGASFGGCGAWCVWNAGGRWRGIEAFGTLLGPEITGSLFWCSGPFAVRGAGVGACCFWFPARTAPVVPVKGVPGRV